MLKNQSLLSLSSPGPHHLWAQEINIIFYIINNHSSCSFPMFSATKLLKLLKSPISNIQTHIDMGRVIQHKKFQMMNQLSLSRTLTNDPAPKKRLEKNEIQTRILKLLYESDLVDLNQFRFQDDIRKEYYLDSLDVTALVSSIEEEFNTIFDPDTYENARSLDVIVEALMNDETIV